jgi:peptidoglycan-associated lipoprotein
MGNKKILVLLLSISLSFSASAQYVLKEADIAFELYNYSKAIDLYEQAWKKKESLHAAERLTLCYSLQNDYEQRESWAAIAAQWPGSPAQNTLNYADALRGNSKYREAKTEYNKYADLNKTLDLRLKDMWLQSCDSAMSWMKSPKQVNIQNERTLNSAQSDWGAVEYQGSIVFSSDRVLKGRDMEGKDKPFLKFDGAKLPDKNIYGWTGNPYLRLYTKKGKDSLKLFPLTAGTYYHVGPASFTLDGSVLYFTLTRIPEKLDYTKVKLLKGKQATVNVEIYSAKKDASGQWGNVVAFPYNDVNRFSNGDPFISADGQSLYFISNRPGGKGGTDLYVCRKTDAGDWGVPVTLKEVNTEGNERTPVFDMDNNFYFSSDGRIGMGGLDVYKAKLVGGKISTPENLAYPINSPQDDFAYNLAKGGTGYFSSNRKEGLGEDDIYSFIQVKIPNLKLSGRVYDKATGALLSGAIVTLTHTGGIGLKVETDETGQFRFNINEQSNYSLNGKKTNYRSNEVRLSTKGQDVSSELKQDLYLERIEIDKTIRLENIYYDFNRSDIRADAALELDKLIKLMKDNPTVWLEIGSHTDSRGNDQYNQWLSQSRANAAVQYLIDRGVNKNRIDAKGYGESSLLNKCANGVKCTEAEHQLNRRTEFKITRQ